MSWSISAVGSAPAVAQKIREDLERSASHFSEPEATVCRNIANVVDSALSAFPDSSAVRVSGHGHQSTTDGKATNTVRLEIEPIYGLLK